MEYQDKKEKKNTLEISQTRKSCSSAPMLTQKWPDSLDHQTTQGRVTPGPLNTFKTQYATHRSRQIPSPSSRPSNTSYVSVLHLKLSLPATNSNTILVSYTPTHMQTEAHHFYRGAQI